MQKNKCLKKDCDNTIQLRQKTIILGQEWKVYSLYCGKHTKPKHKEG